MNLETTPINLTSKINDQDTKPYVQVLKFNFNGQKIALNERQIKLIGLIKKNIQDTSIQDVMKPNSPNSRCDIHPYAYNLSIDRHVNWM